MASWMAVRLEVNSQVARILIARWHGGHPDNPCQLISTLLLPPALRVTARLCYILPGLNAYRKMKTAQVLILRGFPIWAKRVTIPRPPPCKIVSPHFSHLLRTCQRVSGRAIAADRSFLKLCHNVPGRVAHSADAIARGAGKQFKDTNMAMSFACSSWKTRTTGSSASSRT